MSGFLGRFVERQGVLHVLKPLNFERFRFSLPETTPLFDFIVAHEGIKTDCGVWSSAQKLKILRRLRLFRLVVTGVGRLQPASVKLLQAWSANSES